MLCLWKDQLYSESCTTEDRKINVMYINHEMDNKKKKQLLCGIIACP